MFWRDLRGGLPSLPTQGPILAAELRSKLAASRDKALGRSNARPICFSMGEPALLWNQGTKRYQEEVTITDPNPGLDGASMSYWVEGATGRPKLVHVSWLIKLPPVPEEGEGEEEA